MPAESRNKPVEAQVVGRLGELCLRRIRCHHKTGRVVYAFEHQPPAEQLVAPAVGCLVEGRVYFEIGLFVAYRCLYAITVLQKKEVPEERRRGLAKSALTV